MRSIPGRAQPLMTTTDTTGRALLLALVAAAAIALALALLLRPLVAHGLALLLTLAGWRPSPARPAPAPLQQAPAPPAAKPSRRPPSLPQPHPGPNWRASPSVSCGYWPVLLVTGPWPAPAVAPSC